MKRCSWSGDRCLPPSAAAPAPAPVTLAASEWPRLVPGRASDVMRRLEMRSKESTYILFHYHWYLIVSHSMIYYMWCNTVYTVNHFNKRMSQFLSINALLRSLAPCVLGLAASACACASHSPCPGATQCPAGLRGQGPAWRAVPGSGRPLCGGRGACRRFGIKPP